MSKSIKAYSYLNILGFVVLSLLLSSCTWVFLPKHQKVVFKTNSDDNEVYLDNELICKGKISVTKIDKTEAVGRVVIIRKGYKPVNDVIVRLKRPIAYYPLALISVPTVLGIALDAANPKSRSFSSEITLNTIAEESLLPFRKEDEKYLDVKNISLDIKDYTKDIAYINIYHSSNLLEDLDETEKIYNEERLREEEKLASKKLKENRGKKLDDTQNELNIKIEDTKYSADLFKTLKETNYIDTINKIFNDQNNTLVLEASIKKITNYIVTAKWDKYYKAKLNITWYLKNTYNEILDTIEVSSFSGNFYSNEYINNYNFLRTDVCSKIIRDAILISYVKLSKNNIFTENIKLNKDFVSKEDKLIVSGITGDSKVSDKIDAFKATVIVKAKSENKNMGHGSGFTISKDGYILTNYHVIAGKTANKQNDIFIITSTGKELPAKIVRFNKFRDVALLKVDYNFEKAFQLDNKDKAAVMMDVYTIGAPKSIELGQSISVGIIANIRDVNENKYLQLGMAINGGNSGGPIFDTQGQLHGIVVSKLVGFSTEGIGFAIPSCLVAEYLNLTIN